MRVLGWMAAALATLLWAAAVAQGAVTVAPGETLSEIAARHGTTVRALAATNGIPDPDAIVAGTRLSLPGSAAPAAAGPAPGGVVTVAPGDTLSGIAARHGTTVSALAAANGLSNPNAIVAGRRLRLPDSASGGAVAPASLSGGGSYRIRPGETLGAIAARHGTTVAALAALNGIRNPNLVVAGSAIWLPAGGAAPSAAGPRPSAAAPSGTSVTALIEASAARHGVDAGLARAIAWQESGFSQAALSSAGAIGVMQLMPATAAWLGADVLGRSIDPHRVDDNVDAGVAYLAWLQRRAGSASEAIAGYYQGLSSVRRIGFYDDTKQYVANVLAQVGRV